MGNDATCGDFAADDEEREPLVEEVEVEGKAHAEGMHARTAGNEKARTNLIALEISKPEQARTKASSDRNRPAKHRVDRKATQARSKKRVRHGLTSLPGDEFSPT
jgi:IS5 family transposase